MWYVYEGSVIHILIGLELSPWAIWSVFRGSNYDITFLWSYLCDTTQILCTFLLNPREWKVFFSPSLEQRTFKTRETDKTSFLSQSFHNINLYNFMSVAEIYKHERNEICYSTSQAIIIRKRTGHLFRWVWKKSLPNSTIKP